MDKQPKGKPQAITENKHDVCVLTVSNPLMHLGARKINQFFSSSFFTNVKASSWTKRNANLEAIGRREICITAEVLSNGWKKVRA